MYSPNNATPKIHFYKGPDQTDFQFYMEAICTSAPYLKIYGGLMATTGLTTLAPTSGTAATWKLGSAVSTSGITLDTTKYIQVDVGGASYKIAVVSGGGSSDITIDNE